MVLQTSLSVLPIYGMGWIDVSTDQGIEVPPPFRLGNVEIDRAERFKAVGLVGQYGHLLDGLWVMLSRRHVATGTLVCNLSAHDTRPAISDDPTQGAYFGYADVCVISI